MGEMEEGKGQATESISVIRSKVSISDSGFRQFGATCWSTPTLTGYCLLSPGETKGLSSSPTTDAESGRQTGSVFGELRAGPAGS